MKRTTQYKKGEHFYVKYKNKKEVYNLQKPKKLKIEYDKEYQEFYINNFHFDIKENGILIYFGKKMFGMSQAKDKSVIRLDIKSAKNLSSQLKGILKD